MKRDLELKKQTLVIIQKEIFLVPYSKKSPLALMHLWHLSTIRSFWEEYFAGRL